MRIPQLETAVLTSGEDVGPVAIEPGAQDGALVSLEHLELLRWYR